jgi:hypothetical protein
MATLAARYDGQTIEHYTIRWQQDLTAPQRGAIASEIERDRMRPSFRMVKPSDLYVDETYQRPLSADRVWEIASTFTWSLFDPLWVGDRKRRGTLYVVDGRHRLAAASILGPKLIDAVPCQIRVTESVEEEARIFVELQERRRKITSAQRFAAKLVFKDPIALELQSIMSKYGFKVASDKFGGSALDAAQNEITAVGTLEKIFRAGGRSRVHGVLTVIRQAWDGVPPTTSAWVLRAVNRLLEREPGKKPETFARKLKEKDPWGLIERGQRFAHSNEIPTSEALADVLIKVTE